MESLDTNTPKEPKLRDIVCLYSQADESFYLQLKKSLNLWERGGHVRWLEVRPGEELSVTLRDHVKRADLILFLLSSDFFADERCYQTMHLALQEQASRQVPVVPILVRAVNWQLSACKDLAIVPHNEQPVASWPLPDEAYTSIGADLVLLVPGWPPIPSPAPPKLFQVRDLPNGYVPRPAVFDEIKHRLLTHGGSQTTAITTALRGAGGFGKTTLALALCHDPEIREAFPDGILWRDLGEHSPEPLMVLNEMLHVLEPSVREALTLEEARKRWKNVLKERSYLLVIDDVWQTEALEELLQGGPHCGRLVTTRNDQMLPEDAKRVWVDAMEPEEAMTLLCQGLIEDWHHTLGRPVLERVVVQQLGCWPLLVSLARGMLTNQVKRLKKTPEQALALVEQAYNDRGMAAFHLGDRIERQRTADACLEVNLRQLEKWAPPHYQARQRYQELAVFPEDMDIPLTTLQAYWQGTGGLHTWEAEDLCLRLVDLSLLLPWNPKQGAVRLHDVLRNYLIQRAGVDLPALHARLLDAYQRVLGLARWADLPRSEAYLWQHLILHLCQAGHDEALQTTLADLGYLARKALYVGVSALEADLFQASTWPPAQAAFPPVTNLSRTIVRIRHLLYQAHTYAEMGSILLSYLTEELATVDQRRALELELPRPFLTNWHPLLNRASSALRCTLRGHTDWVQGCTVSSDGRFIVSASDDHTLKVWDTASGAERLTLSGHTDKVNGCAVSGDGRVIVSASFDGTLKVWDTISGAERLTLTGHTGRVFDCAMSGDGRMIVSASADKTLKVWDAVTGAERLTLTGHSSEVNGCAVSRDGRVIVSASADKTLKVWDAVTGTKRLTLTGHTAHVDACAISPNGRFIVSASWDNTLKVWDRATGAEVRTLRGHINSVSGCAVSLDGSIIVSASYDGTLKVWDAASGAERLTLSGHTSLVSGCAVSDDGSFIVSASLDDTLKVWDTAFEAEWHTFSGHTGRVNSCAVSGDGRLIVSASNDQTLKVWDAASGTERLTLSGHTSLVSGCAVSGDGSFIVSASHDGTLKVWATASGAERHTLSGHSRSVSSCVVSPDGSFIVSASFDGTLKVWDAASGVERLTLKHLDFEGQTLPIDGCAVSGDGRFIVSASRYATLKVWDAITGAERLSLQGHTSGVNACAISPDGQWIVSASSDKTLKVWDAVTGTKRLTLTGHTAGVDACAISPNSRFIVSASWDFTLRVWDAASGACLLTFPVDGLPFGCAFHPDGEHLVVCGNWGVYFLRLVQ